MKKQQLILTGLGILLITLLFFFGTTVAKKETTVIQAAAKSLTPQFNLDSYLLTAKQKLPVNQQNYLANLENSVKRGDVREQQIKAFNQLSFFLERLRTRS